MRIKLKDEKLFKEDLQKLKDLSEKILQKDLSEREFTEENYKEFQQISKDILEIKWLRFDGAKIKIISSDGTELDEV